MATVVREDDKSKMQAALVAWASGQVKTRTVKYMTRDEATASFLRSSLFAARHGVGPRSMSAKLRGLTQREGFKGRVLWDNKTLVFKPESVVLPVPEAVAAPLPRYVSSSSPRGC